MLFDLGQCLPCLAADALVLGRQIPVRKGAATPSDGLTDVRQGSTAPPHKSAFWRLNPTRISPQSNFTPGASGNAVELLTVFVVGRM